MGKKSKSNYKKGRERCIDFAMSVYDFRTALTTSLEQVFTWIYGIPPALTPHTRMRQYEEIVEPCLDAYGDYFASDLEERVKRHPRYARYWRPYVGIIASVLPKAIFEGWYSIREIARETGYSESTVRVALWLISKFTELPPIR